jgi:DNA sulfur modification protein DndE
MQTPLNKFRVSEPAKEQLIQLKRWTGIKQWNVLCRWALCASLAERTAPTPAPLPPMSNVEMSWAVFAGPLGDVLWALLRQRSLQDTGEVSDDAVVECFKLHLHRGIAHLHGERIRSIEDLHALALR